MEIDADVSGCLPQQPHELTFGRLQRGVRHIVDEPDREIDVNVFRMAVLVFSPLLRRDKTGADDQSPLFQQDVHVASRAPIPSNPPQNHSAASSRLACELALASA